ncbi:hypothetical protein LTR86_000389 [Recurvomyces mirabilis]|nr:hypothetical protein LTR86_000389 [Recurvomyces mirabilis]
MILSSFSNFAERDGKEKLILDQGNPDEWPPLTLAELFGIELRHEWQCEDCGHLTILQPVSGEEGHGIGLTVDLQTPERHWSLVEYLQQNVFREKMKIRCEDRECSSKRKSGRKAPSKERLRHKAITKAPEILVLRLSRFAQIELPNGKG